MTTVTTADAHTTQPPLQCAMYAAVAMAAAMLAPALVRPSLPHLKRVRPVIGPGTFDVTKYRVSRKTCPKLSSFCSTTHRF